MWSATSGRFKVALALAGSQSRLPEQREGGHESLTRCSNADVVLLGWLCQLRMRFVVLIRSMKSWRLFCDSQQAAKDYKAVAIERLNRLCPNTRL